MKFNFSPTETELEVLDDGNIYVGVSDNVLDEEDYGVTCLTMHNGAVQSCEEVREGAYSELDMIGLTVDQIHEWLEFDSTGQHPETYHQLVEMVED